MSENKDERQPAYAQDDNLDDADMPYFQRMRVAQAHALEAKRKADLLDSRAQAVTDFFYEGAREKYKLNEGDQITQSGQIIRLPE